MRLSPADVRWLFEKLRKVDFLSYHSEDELTRLVSSMEKSLVGPGAKIIRQAQKGKAYYIIRRGSVRVWAEAPEGARKLATLGEGDSFGEVSILTGEVCNASVSAESETELFALLPQSLKEAARANPRLAEQMAEAITRRKGARGLGLEVSATAGRNLVERLKDFFGLP